MKISPVLYSHMLKIIYMEFFFGKPKEAFNNPIFVMHALVLNHSEGGKLLK